MTHLAIFRLLLVLFVSLYMTALISGLTVDTSAFPELHDYQEGLEVNFGGFRVDVLVHSWIWLLGHLVEIIGLLLLFCRRRDGLWLAISGAALAAWASWAVALPSSLFELHTTTTGLLWSATCVCWGAYVCMGLLARRELFVTRQKPEHVQQPTAGAGEHIP